MKRKNNYPFLYAAILGLNSDCGSYLYSYLYPGHCSSCCQAISLIHVIGHCHLDVGLDIYIESHRWQIYSYFYLPPEKLDQGLQSWLHMKMTWGDFFKYQCLDLIHTNWIRISRNGTQASEVFKAPQLILICNQGWELWTQEDALAVDDHLNKLFYIRKLGSSPVISGLGHCKNLSRWVCIGSYHKGRIVTSLNIFSPSPSAGGKC